MQETVAYGTMMMTLGLVLAGMAGAPSRRVRRLSALSCGAHCNPRRPGKWILPMDPLAGLLWLICSAERALK